MTHPNCVKDSTEFDSKDYFDFFCDCHVVLENKHGKAGTSVENLYQAFKSRYERELKDVCK